METLTKYELVGKKPTYKPKMVWKMVIILSILHIVGIYGLYLTVSQRKIATFMFGATYGVLSSLGVTAGAHRLWCHRSYKAVWQMRVFLMLWHTAALQNSLYEWCRDHRVHHKFSETDADPHNANRGFFFSHVGWLMMKKHPDVLSKGKTVDMSDIAADPVVIWQKKNYVWLVLLLTFVLPGLTPWYFWGESLKISLLSAITRYVISLNMTWLVNSAAHLWGNKPYDKNIGPAENFGVVFLTIGEGYHNYHHTFPWDYKAAELGNYRFNLTTGLIDLFALIGWAYDLKTVKVDVIRNRAIRTGDGSHRPLKGTPLDANDTQYNGIIRSGQEEENEEECETHDGEVEVQKNGDCVWGWGDVDMQQDHVRAANIVCPRRVQAVM